MSEDFGALDAYLDPGIVFTLRDRKYRIEPPTAEVGLWCERIAAIAGGLRQAKTEAEVAEALARVERLPQLDGDEKTIAQRVLGSVYDELVADGVDHHRIKLLGQTAFVWIVGDEAAAKKFVEAGGRPPEPPAPNRAARRASRATAGATTTRKPASTSGTKSRKTTTSPAPASRSRGRKSSPAGGS